MRGRGSWRQQGEPLKFESDFDFDASNAQFDKEEIEKELKQKLTIGGSEYFVVFSVTCSIFTHGQFVFKWVESFVFARKHVFYYHLFSVFFTIEKK
jgi:hypothetical protein